MKKLFISVLGAMILSSANLMADEVLGQKYYLKIMKDHIGLNGTRFAALYTQAEWEQKFSDGTFEKEFGEKYPKLNKWFESTKWTENIKPHIKDFAIKYAKDSGNVPSC